VILGWSGGVGGAGHGAAALPDDWGRAWEEPGVEMRPLQIVHGPAKSMASAEGIKALKDMGLGGIVCNVHFDRYMESPEYWETLTETVRACAEGGMRVWIYDEDGYPSGAAGGLVLERNKDFEALALTYDAGRDEPFVLRRAYEHTHASNNFYAARRYPNLIDDEAMACFVELTHEAYWERLKEHFGATIEAFFTDEPSLMAVNIGQLGEDVRKRVRVVDPVDEAIRPLPAIPWVRDLPELYRQRYGGDIMAVRRSLFTGDGPEDVRVRRQFWGLISDLMAQRYFGRLQEWASAHKVASSGHSLWEEMPLHHVPLEGNALKSLMRMDIPGLDMLSSDPEAVIYTGWLTATLPASAALFNGGRRVMTEVSDFSQTLGGGSRASLEQMQATAAWQAALGVTEFTLYYDYRGRSAREYQRYCSYVGRLNSLLRSAEPWPGVLLYYPIYDLWGEYRPVAEKLTLESQSERARRVVQSFMDLGQGLMRRQVGFAVADHELFGEAAVRGSRLVVRGREFGALVLPGGVELPEAARGVVERFEAAGGRVVRATDMGAGVDFAALRRASGYPALTPANDRIVVGRFRRHGSVILLLVNVGNGRYVGALRGVDGKRWVVGRPESGSVEMVSTVPGGRLDVLLEPRASAVLVGLSAEEP